MKADNNELFCKQGKILCPCRDSLTGGQPGDRIGGLERTFNDGGDYDKQREYIEDFQRAAVLIQQVQHRGLTTYQRDYRGAFLNSKSNIDVVSGMGLGSGFNAV